jgi:5-hydroxyisourate hydrolase
MSGITTHILDTSRGRPAAGVPVTLSVEEGGGWKQLASATSDADGRVSNLLPGQRRDPLGTYRLRFEVHEYFTAHGVTGFYPYVEITFSVRDGGHYHVPLLLSPFGYSTYRGS